MTNDQSLQHYIRRMSRCADPNRSHEECYGCALQDSNPPQCLGHYEGPTSCPMFIAAGTRETRTVGWSVSGNTEVHLVPAGHAFGYNWTLFDPEDRVIVLETRQCGTIVSQDEHIALVRIDGDPVPKRFAVHLLIHEPKEEDEDDY